MEAVAPLNPSVSIARPILPVSTFPSANCCDSDSEARRGDKISDFSHQSFEQVHRNSLRILACFAATKSTEDLLKDRGELANRLVEISRQGLENVRVLLIDRMSCRSWPGAKITVALKRCEKCLRFLGVTLFEVEGKTIPDFQCTGRRKDIQPLPFIPVCEVSVTQRSKPRKSGLEVLTVFSGRFVVRGLRFNRRDGKSIGILQENVEPLTQHDPLRWPSEQLNQKVTDQPAAKSTLTPFSGVCQPYPGFLATF